MPLWEVDLYSSIQRLPPLTHEEERQLFWCRRQATPEQRARIDDFLVRSNIGFATDEAQRWGSRGAFLAVRRAAVRGLYDALRRFDERRGWRFISYAVWWMRRYIQRELMERRTPVRPADRTRREWRALGQAHAAATCQHTLTQLLDQIRCHGDARADLLNLLLGPVYLDDTLSEQDDRRVADVLVVSPPSEDEDTWSARLDDPRAAIDAALAGLDQRRRQVIIRYYGLGGEAPAKLEQIGRELGITRERVRQLRNHALDLLRQAMLDNATPELLAALAKEGAQAATDHDTPSQQRAAGSGPPPARSAGAPQLGRN